MFSERDPVDMTKFNVLYNPVAGRGWNNEKENAVRAAIGKGDPVFYDMTSVNYTDFFSKFSEDDKLLIVGGDGTLNRFINDTSKIKITCPVYYYAGGSGNDFLHDIGGETGKAVQINQYIENLPSVDVKGKRYKFLNGIGYGIDGYCCEVGDAMKDSGKTDINYAGIAISGLLFHFKPSDAVVTVDGVSHTYRDVWLAPTMNGRFYGGGMMPTPDQNRLGDGSLSVLVWHGRGKLRTLCAFPSIFKGEHLSNPKMCEVLTGRNINVKFAKPCALQIDGETICGVSEYTAVSATATADKTASANAEKEKVLS